MCRLYSLKIHFKINKQIPGGFEKCCPGPTPSPALGGKVRIREARGVARVTQPIRTRAQTRLPCCQPVPFYDSVFWRHLLRRAPCDPPDPGGCHLSARLPQWPPETLLVAERELLCIFCPLSVRCPCTGPADAGEELRALHTRKALATKDQRANCAHQGPGRKPESSSDCSWLFVELGERLKEIGEGR